MDFLHSFSIGNTFLAHGGVHLDPAHVVVSEGPFNLNLKLISINLSLLLPVSPVLHACGGCGPADWSVVADITDSLDLIRNISVPT